MTTEIWRVHILWIFQITKIIRAKQPIQNCLSSGFQERVGITASKIQGLFLSPGSCYYQQIGRGGAIWKRQVSRYTTVFCGGRISRRRPRILCLWCTPWKRRSQESRGSFILISTDTAMRRMGLMWICWSFKRNLD